MYAVTKLEKMHQNCKICQADFALTYLMKIQHNFQFHQTDFPLRNLTKNLPKLSNPWTFSWFDEILPNLPFSLLHVILDLGEIRICQNKFRNILLIVLRYHYNKS